MSKAEKTNVMRILEAASIPYTPHYYAHKGNEAVDGIAIANLLDQPYHQVFKTLVTKCASGEYAVFVIPVHTELDLKAAARAVHEKSAEMIAVKELLKITGYIRGGCSPIGMKKQFRTVIDQSALSHSTIMVSAGKIGFQIEINPKDLISIVNASTDTITKSNIV